MLNEQEIGRKDRISSGLKGLQVKDVPINTSSERIMELGPEPFRNIHVGRRKVRHTALQCGYLRAWERHVNQERFET